MKAYKGFNKDMTCRGFQYKEGETYETDRAKLCECGFHACEAPLKVWDFYPPVDGNRFCEVEQDGNVEKEGEDGKSVSTKIKIGAEIGIPGLVKAHVEWCKKQTMDATKTSDMTDRGCDSAQIGSSGDYAKIGSSGDYAQIGSSGYSAKIGSSGCSAKIGSSGYSAKIGSSGDYAQIGSSGDYAKIGSSGYSAKIDSSGYSAKIGSSGYYAQIGSSGYSAKIGSSGCSAKIGSSGDYAKIGSSGDYAQIGSSGDSAQIGSSGDYAQIGSSGCSAKIECTGKNAVVACAGANTIVKAPVGAWVCLSEYGEVDGKVVCVGMKAFRIDGKKYKADTWYKLQDGKVVKAEEDE